MTFNYEEVVKDDSKPETVKKSKATTKTTQKTDDKPSSDAYYKVVSAADTITESTAKIAELQTAIVEFGQILTGIQGTLAEKGKKAPTAAYRAMLEAQKEAAETGQTLASAEIDTLAAAVRTATDDMRAYATMFEESAKVAIQAKRDAKTKHDDKIKAMQEQSADMEREIASMSEKAETVLNAIIKPILAEYEAKKDKKA